MYRIVLPGPPIPAARPRVTKYSTYNPKQKQQEETSWIIKSQFHHMPLSGPISLSFEFLMPIPTSYSKKQKALLIGQPHSKKPDIDNLLIFCLNSANGILWIDDALVYNINATKLYSENPKTEIIIER